MSGCFSQHCVTNTKLPFKALESPLKSTFCFGLRAQNNEAGQPKSLHCFHSATLYLYYSLQYPLSSLVLTTPVSIRLFSSSIFSLSSHLPSFPYHCDIQYPSQLRKKLKCESRRLHTVYSLPVLSPLHAGFLFFISFSKKKRRWREKKKKSVDVSPKTCDLCLAHSWK